MLLKVIEFSIICLLALQNEALAYEKTELQEPLEPGMAVEITGEIIWRNFGKTFYVNFQEANDDTPLHVSVRYDKDELILNNWTNGEWGQEEVHSDLPGRNGRKSFYKYIGYTLRITARDNDFHINLNAREYNFKYRMPKEDLGKIKFLVIAGDFDVTDVNWLRN